MKIESMTVKIFEVGFWRAIALGVLLCALALGVVSRAAANPDKAGKVSWFNVTLKRGEISGYHWAVGAKGQRNRPLRHMCAEVSMVEPPQEGTDYVEGGNSTECGRLEHPNDSVVGTESFGSGQSRVTVLEAVFRPVVRKVTFLLSTGERKTFLARVAQIPHRATKGIPTFRFVVFPFEGEACIRGVAMFDGKGRVVSRQVSAPC
jgi:hypothetical protein